jgi:hypothetical protein
MGTEIEALAVGNCFLRKEDQDPALKSATKASSTSTERDDRSQGRGRLLFAIDGQ